MRVPVVDLAAQYDSIKAEIDAAIARVLKHGQFILGPEVKTFEAEMAAYLGTKFAIGVASGTDALRLALLACGIRPGDEVITTAFTFVATAETIIQCGATPVFVDIDPKTYNIDPAQIEAKITSRTKAVIPVHLFGQPSDMNPIIDIARKHDLKVIEDCAQSLGAEYRGKKAGSIGNAGCLSFFPSKNLGAYGDGGMVVTSDLEIAKTVDILRKHGANQSYHHQMPGYNSRLDTLQAAVLSTKLKHLEKWDELRRCHATLYNELLGRINGIEPPFVEDFCLPSCNYYTIRLKSTRINRNELREHMASMGIGTMVYYPLCLHLQEAYRGLGYNKGDLPESERAQDEVLSLPMYSELNEGQIQEVVQVIREFAQDN